MLLAVAMVAVHVIASFAFLRSMWGAHFYGFYPEAVGIVTTLLLVFLLVVIVVRRGRIDDAIEGLEPQLTDRRLRMSGVAVLVAGTALFWFARICHTYLGDGHIIVQRIDRYREILEREPLTSILQYGVYAVTRPWFADPSRQKELVSQDAVAVGSVVAGTLFLLVAWHLATEIARLVGPKQRRWLIILVWLTIVSQGYVQLFFGYVENYTFQFVGLTFFLWLCLRHARGASPLLFPGLALILCVALHLGSVAMVVPFAVLAVMSLIDPERRRDAVRDLVVLVAAGAGTAFLFARLRPGYNPLETLLAMGRTAFTTSHDKGYMLSQRHYRDFFNEQILVGPLGLFLFLIVTGIGLRDRDVRRHRAVPFLLAAGAVVLATSWTFLDSNLGYARDWDLLAHTGLVFTVGGLGLTAVIVSRNPGRAALPATLLCCVLISFYHTVPWIALNSSEPHSLARLKSLPLGGGRTEVVVSSWYRIRGDEIREKEWLMRALQVNPKNTNAYYLLGLIEMNHRNYDAAVKDFESVVSLRKSDPKFHFYLVLALRAANRLPETIPHLEFIAKTTPNDLVTLTYLGEAYEAAGQTARAQAAFARIETLARDYVTQNKDEGPVLACYGWALYKLGRPREAVVYLNEALEAKKPAPIAHCYLAAILDREGDAASADRHYRDCLGGVEHFPGRAAIAARLGIADAGPTAPAH